MCEEMLEHNLVLFDRIRNTTGMQYDHDCIEVVVTPYCLLSLKALSATLKSLSVLFFTADRRDKVYKRLVSRLEQKREKLELLFEPDEFICWLEQTGVTTCRLCDLLKQLDSILHEDVWSSERPYLLTSATLSVGGDFRHFMHQMGTDLLGKKRILTASKASPFDYQSHALLYLPMDMPFPDMRKQDYVEAVLLQLEQLIMQSHGHTLVLFTSYRMMETVYRQLSVRITTFALFFMGKGRLGAIQDFRKSGNGILLASDSAGEGIDLAGDILSSLVVVKLPFPTPDPVMEYERSLYQDFHDYLSEIIVPSMLMKLRQWMGRGIRRETDTCVFSILDCRASGWYRNDILAALPDMPVTDRIEDVGRFIHEHKSDSYFDDADK